jgi:hypothetical protein
MILRVAIHPKDRQFGDIHELWSDRLGMESGFYLLTGARGFSFGSLGLE